MVKADRIRLRSEAVRASPEPTTRRPRSAACAVAIGLLVAACAGSAPSASSPAEPTPSDFPPPAASAPLPWTSLTPTPVVTKPFSGIGSQYAKDVVAHRDGFVAVGEDFQSDSHVDGAIWVTPDGTTWHRLDTTRNDLAGAVLDHVATDGTKLVALGHERTGPGGDEQDRLAWVSDDAEHWRRVGLGQSFGGTFGVAGVSGGPSGFVAWGNPTTNAEAWHSSDGVHWDEATAPRSFASATITRVRSFRGGFVAVGAHVVPPPNGQLGPGGPDTSTAMGWWSPDGMAWATADSAAGPGMQDVEVGSGGLLGLGNSGCGGCVSPRQLWRSSDGRSWQRIGTDLQYSPAYDSDGARIVRYDWQESGDLAWSTDGTSWTTIGHLERPEMYGFTIGTHGLLIMESIAKGGTGDEVDAAMWFVRASS